MESVEDELWREQLHAALDEALSKLPEGELEIILAKYYRGHSLSDLGPGARSTHDKAMRKLRCPTVTASLREFIEELTPYYAHVGSETFQRTGESAVEVAVFRREQMAERGLSSF